MSNKTPLYPAHLAAGGKVVDFAGWQLPVHYGSQLEEHHQVRNDAGMFDVSHMCRLHLSGQDSGDFLRHLVANNIDKLTEPGKALYTPMLLPQGGVIDDLIIYRLDNSNYRVVVNAATREKDLAWMFKQAIAFDDVNLALLDDTAMIAVQGPQAREKTLQVLSDTDAVVAAGLDPFFGAVTSDLFIGRTGYTGEDGFEIVTPATGGIAMWDKLLAAGVKPCGLGARDTLRLEAGMCLYGHDLDETSTPLESGIAWTIGWQPQDRDFIGRSALAQQKSTGIPRRLVGLLLEGKGVLRDGQTVQTTAGDGLITSGGFSPTLNRSIALARVPWDCRPGSDCSVLIRKRPQPARVVKFPFVRNGKAV
ncbi:MAG TPA: glycine cleavage system aminomethyltransferase GcvT [Gammaproteobacteria bacterium]|nr:glycine cleavage system aminomethyltransferase GcvT [Gammaproteobacteria bacterium]